MKKIRQLLEVMLTRLGLTVLPRLSRKSILCLAEPLGHIAYVAAVHLRRVGTVNLDLAFGNALSPKQKRRILRESFRTFALVVLDVFWFTRETDERIHRHITFDPRFRELTPGKARICVTAHLGNWEVLGHAATLNGFPLVSVAAPLRNPLVDELFTDIRGAVGQQVLSKHGAVRWMLSTLKKNGNIGLLLDQNTKPAQGGVFVDFFGLPVPVSAAGASLALRTGAEIAYGFCVPQPDGNYCIVVPARDVAEQNDGEDFDAATLRLTQVITRRIEDEVRRRPGAWLWMYKRWKYVAPGRSRSEYPFYAKELTRKPS